MPATQLQLSIVADADPKAVEALGSRMETLANNAHNATEEIKNLTRELSQLEKWRAANPGGIAPGMTISDVSGSSSSGAAHGPGATVAMGAGGLATAPSLEPLKQYTDRAQYLTDVAKKMKSEFQVLQKEVEEVSEKTGGRIGGLTGRMRALRAAMYELTSVVPGLSQVMTIFQYGAGGFGALTLGAVALGTSLKILIDEFTSLQKVLNETALGGGGANPIAGLTKNMGDAVIQIAKATKEWELSLQAVHAQLQAVHTVQEAMLDVEHKRAQQHLEIDKAVNRVTQAQEIVRAKDIEVQDRQKRLAETERAARAEEEAQRKKLGPAAGRTVEEQNALAIEAENEARTLRERVQGAESGLKNTEAGIAGEQAQFNEDYEGMAYPWDVAGLARRLVLGNARKFNTYQEYRAKYHADPLEDMMIQKYFARKQRLEEGRNQAQRFRQTLEGARAQLGPAEVRATEERARANMLPGYQEMLTRHQSESQARAMEEKAAQDQDRIDLFNQLRETPEGSEFEQFYNSNRELFRNQRIGRRAMDAEELYAAQEMMFRMTGRRLSGPDLEAAYSADPTSARYQQMVIGGAGALMTRGEQFRQQAEFQYNHPFNAVTPRAPGEQRFDAALRQAQSTAHNTQVFVNTVGTYLEGVLTFQQRLQKKIEDLDKKTRSRQQDAQIPGT